MPRQWGKKERAAKTSLAGIALKMTEKLRELDTVEELDAAIEESHNTAVLLFKHSTTCPISLRAFREFESFLLEADPAKSYHLITIQRSRNVSNEAAARLSVPHESPQAILIRNGRPVWNASHYEITRASLSQAVAETA